MPVVPGQNATTTNTTVWKDSVRAATTGNGTLATSFENGDSLDGVTLATGDRILLKNQTTASENGAYVVAASGAPARASDLAAAAAAANVVFSAEEGTANAGKAFICTSNSGSDVVGTDSLSFSELGGASSSAINDLTDVVITSVASGELIKYDGANWINNTLVEAAIAASSLTLTTNTGIKGGGDLTANRTLTLDIDGLTEDTTPDPTLDMVATYDDSGTTYKKIKLATLVDKALPVLDTTAVVKGSADATKLVRIEADGLTTATTRTITMPDQNIDLTPNSGTFPGTARLINTATGLTGGGDLTADRTIDYDVNALTADASPDGAADVVVTYDDDAATHKKVLLNNLPGSTLPVADTTNIAKGSADATKIVRFECDTNITTGNTRTIIVADQDVDLTPNVHLMSYTAPKLSADLNLNTFEFDDANGNQILEFTETASATNHVHITNAATGNAAKVEGAGSDTDVELELAGKGAKIVKCDSSYGSWTTDVDGATITFDLSLTNLHKVTLGGNRTLALSNTNDGQPFVIQLIQDGTPPRTVTWFSTIKWQNGTVPTLSTGSGDIDTFGFIRDGAATYLGYILGQDHA